MNILYLSGVLFALGGIAILILDSTRMASSLITYLGNHPDTTHSEDTPCDPEKRMDLELEIVASRGRKVSAYVIVAVGMVLWTIAEQL